MRALIVGLVVLAIVVGLVVWGVGINNQLVGLEQNVNEKSAQVQNVYQRRADLIPNLVETVKGFATQERTVLDRGDRGAREGHRLQLTPEALNDPKAHGALPGRAGSALRRAEPAAGDGRAYPELKSNQNFLQLQCQLEGTENRIAVERRRFNEAVREYNTRLGLFPGSIVARLLPASAQGVLRGGARRGHAAEGEVLACWR